MWLPLTTRDIGSVGAPTVKTTGAATGHPNPRGAGSVRGDLGGLGGALAAGTLGCRRARRSRRSHHATALAAAATGDRDGGIDLGLHVRPDAGRHLSWDRLDLLGPLSLLVRSILERYLR